MARSRSHKNKKYGTSAPATEKAPRGIWQRCYCGAWVPTILGTLGLIVVVELILALAGVLPANVYDDPFVGFSSTQPLFVPGGPGSTVMVTAENKLRFFNPQEFPREKGDDTYRIFCLGGSTTFGRPYDDNTAFSGWLREMLPVADPSRNWEVINAGGISYASYRVALLVEELVHYEPDLFIVYTGHNEFLEKRTYGHLTAGPGLLDSTLGLLGKTRMYTVAKRFHKGREESATTPESAVLTTEVVTRLEQSIGPKDYTRDSLFTDEVIEHFQFNLNRMVTLAEGAGASIMFVTPAAKLRDCSPFKSEHRADFSEEALATWDLQLAQAKAAGAAEDWRQAEQHLSVAIDGDDQYAQAFYLRGRARYALGNYEDAKADFLRARDLDVCPLRALSAMVDAVRDTAAARSIPYLDFEALIAERAAHGVPGSDFFLDHVHPTIAGYQMIAEALLDEFGELLSITLPPDWEAVKMAAIASTVTGRLDKDANALALRNLAQVMSWAGKFEEARELARQTIELTPEDPEAHYLLAWNAQSLNDAVRAEAHYRNVIALQPDHPMATLKLGQVLDAVGKKGDALALYREAVAQRPADPVRRVELAELLVAQGDLVGARKHYHSALEMVPGDGPSHAGLGTIALQEGNLSEARDQFRRALVRIPEDYAAHIGMGEALGRMGDLEKAIHHYARAVAADSGKPQPHLRLAWFAMRHPDASKRDADVALSHAERAVNLSGGANAVALNTLAMAHAMGGDSVRAIQVAEDALQHAIADKDERVVATIRTHLEALRKGPQKSDF